MPTAIPFVVFKEKKVNEPVGVLSTHVLSLSDEVEAKDNPGSIAQWGNATATPRWKLFGEVYVQYFGMEICS